MLSDVCSTEWLADTFCTQSPCCEQYTIGQFLNYPVLLSVVSVSVHLVGALLSYTDVCLVTSPAVLV